MLNDLNQIKAQIIDFLDNSNSLIILGIGNDIRGDDGLGPYIINQLTELNENSLENKESDDSDEWLHLINGGSVPENFTGLIKRIGPSHIIIVDATLMNRQAGKIEIIAKENIKDISVSTHSMSLAYLVKFLEQDIDFEIIFIGIQPEIMDLSFELSQTVKESSDDLIAIFKEILF